MEFIPLTPPVWEQLEKLENLLFDNPFNATTLENEHNSGAEVLVVGKRGVVHGYMVTQYDGDTTDLLRLAVAPMYQGEGIGSRLLRICVSKCATTILHVRKVNKKALELYKRKGFRVVGTTKKSWVMKLTCVEE